jgi:hypothetical protein
MNISPSLRATFPECNGSTDADPSMPLEEPPFELAPASGPRVPIQELERARLALLESTQAGLPRATAHGQEWTQSIDGPLTSSVPVQDKDGYPLKDFRPGSPDLEMFYDSRVEETKLGAGHLNTVSLMEWEDRDGSKFGLAFKTPIDESDGDDIELFRNVLSFRLAQLLGFDVVSPAEMQICPEDGKGSGPGLFMPKARGDTAKKVGEHHPEIADNPQFIRQTVKLDVVDYLLGSTDRNRNNYFVHQEKDGGITLTGIDNDFSFTEYKPPLPMVLDTEMAEAVLKLTFQALLSIVPPGTLSTIEVDALLDRLSALKTEVREMRAAGSLIDPSQWDANKSKLHDRSVYGRFKLKAGLDTGATDVTPSEASQQSGSDTSIELARRIPSGSSAP